MTEKLKCPFCGAELVTNMLNASVCPTQGCIGNKVMAPREIWQVLIDDKRAQEDLKYTEEELECAKHNYSVLSEQREIAYQNYLKIIGDLQAQLQKTQDALKETTKCINWTIDTIVKGLDKEADIVGCCELTLERIDETKTGV